MNIPRVTIIGSCRVFTTLQNLEQNKLIQIQNNCVYGYTHTTKETIQIIDNAKGSFRFPVELNQFISKNPNKIILTQNTNIDDTDIYIIEISSIKLIKVKSIYLKINETRKYLKEKIPLFDEWINDLIKQKQKNIEYYFNNNYTQDDKSLEIILEYLEIVDQDKTSFQNDIKYIINSLPKNKKILFISHFDIKMKEKNIRIPSRVNIATWLKELTDKYDSKISFYNPRYLLEEFGLDLAIDDTAHYKESFKPTLAEEIYNQLTLG